MAEELAGAPSIPLPIREGLGVGRRAAPFHRRLSIRHQIRKAAYAAAPTPNPSLPGRGVNGSDE